MTKRKIAFVDYILLVSREIADVKMPPNFDDWKGVHKFLRYAHAMDMSVENAARGILEQFGHGETIH